MPLRTDRMNPHQLLEFILACDDRDEIHRIATGWLRANQLAPGEQLLAQDVFLLAARPRTAPGSLDPIAIYSSREAAEAWVASIRDPALLEVLEIHRWQLDEDTDDGYWTEQVSAESGRD